MNYGFLCATDACVPDIILEVTTDDSRVDRANRHMAFSLLHLGGAFWIGSWWLLATLVASVTVVVAVIVPREERYLEARFRPAYLLYKASVRRWL
jgi:hypothetical protein